MKRGLLHKDAVPRKTVGHSGTITSLPPVSFPLVQTEGNWILPGFLQLDSSLPAVLPSETQEDDGGRVARVSV